MLIRLALLYLKKRQSRREERGLVIPNKRRATPSGAFLDATRRAGAVFPSSGVIIRSCSKLHYAHSALLDEKTVPAGLIGLALTGPKVTTYGGKRI
jgi:hypothetical protein